MGRHRWYMPRAGLIDTVVDCTSATLADGSASGFLFHDMTPDSFLDAIRRVTVAYHNKPVWRRLKKNGMAKDFSWRSSAAGYRKIYCSLLLDPRNQPDTSINASADAIDGDAD